MQPSTTETTFPKVVFKNSLPVEFDIVICRASVLFQYKTILGGVIEETIQSPDPIVVQSGEEFVIEGTKDPEGGDCCKVITSVAALCRRGEVTQVGPKQDAAPEGQCITEATFEVVPNEALVQTGSAYSNFEELAKSFTIESTVTQTGTEAGNPHSK